MKKIILTVLALSIVPSVASAKLYGDTPDAKHAWAVHDWNRPLASRWANTTHSSMSAKTDDVMALRRETAAKLYAKIANPKSGTAETLIALAEVISYANEGDYAKDFQACLEKYRNAKHPDRELRDVTNALKILVRCKVIPELPKLK